MSNKNLMKLWNSWNNGKKCSIPSLQTSGREALANGLDNRLILIKLKNFYFDFQKSWRSEANPMNSKKSRFWKLPLSLKSRKLFKISWTFLVWIFSNRKSLNGTKLSKSLKILWKSQSRRFWNSFKKRFSAQTTKKTPCKSCENSKNGKVCWLGIKYV